MTTPSCAGDNTVAALVAGAIDDEARRALEAHLDACADCRRLVADLGRGLTAIGAREQPADGGEPLPALGEKLGRLELRRVIGVGGMGVVYEAHDAALDRRVAVKLLRPDLVGEALGARLVAEAQAMARLRHPNVAVVHDVGQVGARVWVCMELLDGRTLRAWLAEAPRRWRAVVEVFAAAARGLGYVHRAGLVHLDFKPDNVIVERGGRVVVTDFGLAQGASAGVAGPHVVVGTPAYMAPEQRRGEACDARADQYAFGVALEEALAGRGVGAPGWLRAVAAKARSEVKGERFASMEELGAAIDAGVRRARRRAWVLAGAATAGVIALLAARPVATITRWVERPVTARAATAPAPAAAPTAPAAASTARAGREGVTSGGAAGIERPTPRPAAVSPRPTWAASPGRRAAQGPTLAAAPGEPRWVDTPRGPVELSPAGAPASQYFGGVGCEDGSALACSSAAPACPPATVLALQAGCWTCADGATCAPLGWPASCADGTRLTCDRAPPRCPGHELAFVVDGCWVCDDPFACAASGGGGPGGSPGGPKPTPDPTPSPGPSPPDAGPGAASHCGNGMCESPGEDHAGCPSDCCEPGPSGACAPVCGNGFCETGEDHTGCAADCCELDASGACAPTCGNGFCEAPGETAAGCPADCA